MSEVETQSILHELYVFSEWKPEPEYMQKSDGLLPENISSLWRWFKFFGPKKSLIDSVTSHLENQQKWHIALGDEGKVIAVLTDNILEIRTKRSEYATIAARTTVTRDAYPQWRKLVWSPDCSFLVLAYGNGTVSFFDLTASNLFNIQADCTRPGGLECTDNTHAVSEITFMPLRVKDTKWNWEVLVITYDGKLRGYLVSQSEGFKLHHTFRFSGGVAAAAYCEPHATLYVAGVPRAPQKDSSSPLHAGLSAWRTLNDEPYYQLSVVSAELEARLANERFHLYIPYLSNTNLNFIIRMVPSPDNSKLVCLHCNGDISVWRLPLLKATHHYRLSEQPDHAIQSPLTPKHGGNDATIFYPADVNWWSDEEVILSRFSGAVSVCHIRDLVNKLGKNPAFFQGTPRVTCAQSGTFMALECETTVLPGRRAAGDESTEVLKADVDLDNSMLSLTKELFKTVLYAITDMETFQPRPRKITVVSRVYRLLGVKSTTPTELFTRKIESGNYAEALALAESCGLDSDLVYQQQWRKTPVSKEAIQNYLSKVSKKIWAVHQCVDRLPESLTAATELLHFGLNLTNEKILEEINGDLPEEEWKSHEDITPDDLNTFTSEMLRCRHVMLFYKERLSLYEAILDCEKSTYVKDEYDRLRSTSILHSAMEMSKEGRIEALTCLWPYIDSLPMQFEVLDKLPETINPLDYQHLLPTKEPLVWFDKKSPIKVKPSEHEHDWCRKEIFRSIWSSTWSEDMSPENDLPPKAGPEMERLGGEMDLDDPNIIPNLRERACLITKPTWERTVVKWYDRRAREIEWHSGLTSHALTLVTVAAVSGGVPGLDHLMFHLYTLDTLLYDLNVEGVKLQDLERMSLVDTCKLLMKTSTLNTFIEDLKQFVVPYLKRYEHLVRNTGDCLSTLMDYLEYMSTKDLSYVLLVLQTPQEFELDVLAHLELVERCLLAYDGTEHLHLACDLLDTILKETDGSISASALVRRVGELEKLVAGSARAARRGVVVSPRELRELTHDQHRVRVLVARLARSLAAETRSTKDCKPTPEDWADLLKDILDLQTTLFPKVSKEECYEIYGSAMLTCGDPATIRLISQVLTCTPGAEPVTHVDYDRSVCLVLSAAKEYFNSASSLTDPCIELARCCLQVIDGEDDAVQEELDLIAALPLLHEFHLSMLPIQARLHDDKMDLIEECLEADPTAYLASHKLLKLAKLLRIAGDDEQTREGLVLERVAWHAMKAGAAGSAAAADAARRLAALRHAPAAPLLASVAEDLPTQPHIDPTTRSYLLSAALTHAPADKLADMLHQRLKAPLDEIERLAAVIKQSEAAARRCPSVDDEFADAITTPVIDQKDMLPQWRPILDCFMEVLRRRVAADKNFAEGTAEGVGARCPEFYRSLYDEMGVSSEQYAYDRFALSEPATPNTHTLLNTFYVHECEVGSYEARMDISVVQRFAYELVHRDTPLSAACLLRGVRDGAAARVNSETAISAALYAALINCNVAELGDNVYLAKPVDLARTTLQRNNTSEEQEEQLEMIRQCLEKLGMAGEAERIRARGLPVNTLLYSADEDYRRETIYRLARTGKKEDVELACSLAHQHGLDALSVWLQHAAALDSLSKLVDPPPGEHAPDAFTRVYEALWPKIRGNDHDALVSLFTALQKLDDKNALFGVVASDHVQLVKKCKAASQDFNYKLLCERPESRGGAHGPVGDHVLDIMRPENAVALTKLLRSLPQSLRLPTSVHTLYTNWLIIYFFNTPAGGGNRNWMQQYRQCASFFHKMPRSELLRFHAAVCFSPIALHCVPAGTRILMLAQAVEYCNHEQENDNKYITQERPWSQVGQELSRWARFLENFHSSAVQAIIDNSDIPRDTVWRGMEMCHGLIESPLRDHPCAATVLEGSASKLVAVGEIPPADALAAAGALVRHGLRAGALASLLHCLHLDLDAPAVFKYMFNEPIQKPEHIDVLVTCLIQYHKDGVKFDEEMLEKAIVMARTYQLQPRKQLALLAMSQRPRVQDGDELIKIAEATLELFKAEWPDSEFMMELTPEILCTEEGRALAYRRVVSECASTSRRRTLAQALSCWPRTAVDGHSVQSRYLRFLLVKRVASEEILALARLLLERPVLIQTELTWLMDVTNRENILSIIWIVLLSKCENTEDLLHEFIMLFKEYLQNQELDDELIKEMLDQGLFIRYVATPIYKHIVNYIMSAEAGGGDPANTYTVSWATAELRKANYLAEAGHLQLMAAGAPSGLRGFSQSVQNCLREIN